MNQDLWQQLTRVAELTNNCLQAMTKSGQSDAILYALHREINRNFPVVSSHSNAISSKNQRPANVACVRTMIPQRVPRTGMIINDASV